MVVNASGDGGTVAAPIVRQVLAAGLGRLTLLPGKPIASSAPASAAGRR